jgi:multidrug efflux pump subunit AcrB
MFKAIERPVILTVAVLILTLFGILSIFNVPVQMIPDLDARVVTVGTKWPGASPQDVEKEILVEQEKYLGRIPGLERMVSTAGTGSADIELEFPFSVPMAEALLNVNNALSQVPGYPENVDQPSIRAEAFSSNAFMYFRLMPESGAFTEQDIVALRDWVEEYVVQPMERVPGVSSVELRGGAERQLQVLVDPVRLAERGIRLTELRDAIRARNQDVSGGDLDSGKRRYLLRTIGRFDSPEELEDLVIAERDGAFIRLRDVGHAELGYAEVRSYAYSEGKPILGFAVSRQIGTNVIQIKRDMLVRVAELNERLLSPKGLKLLRTADDVVYVTDAVQVVQRNLVIGALLAVLVLFLFLRSVPATLIGAIGIPICTVAAFLGLLLTGRTINVMSLAGVAFAIGMTLDNNIVVLENIYRHLGLGKARLQAALDGVREVWPAVLASTLTTVAVFLPVIFVEEEAGQLYSDIAVAISASILMSMVLAVTVVPAAAGRWLRAPAPHRRRPLLERLGGAFSGVVLGLVHWLARGMVRPLARHRRGAGRRGRHHLGADAGCGVSAGGRGVQDLHADVRPTRLQHRHDAQRLPGGGPGLLPGGGPGPGAVRPRRDGRAGAQLHHRLRDPEPGVRGARGHGSPPDRRADAGRHGKDRPIARAQELFQPRVDLRRQLRRHPGHQRGDQRA